GSLVLLQGCVVRTYQSTKDRLDQDLSTGNRGYLTGNAPAESAERKPTRDIRVVEVELRPLIRFEKGKKTTTVSQPMAEENLSGMEASVETPAMSYEAYTVQKNDTLQKISQKYFGTTRKWMKIYDANKDVLKGPDKIRPGQVLRIPQLGGESLKEPKENLK
ncbi:MAG: LysM peptidoglycan-binding domain-containing protein, partial [Candidatus Omnitrophica bacterium]|nr:LysM peptidoglycan-binding domain-containing protein [Candidatus Omnitrophota bacterium]